MKYLLPLIFIGVIFSCKTENKSKKSTPLDSFSKDYLISFKISPDIYIKQLSDSLNRVLPDTFSYYFDEIEDSMSFKQTYIDELIDSLTYQNYNICVSKQILNDTLFIKNVFYYSGYYRFTGNIEFKRDKISCVHLNIMQLLEEESNCKLALWRETLFCIQVLVILNHFCTIHMTTALS